MQAVLLAGGLGTRLRSVVADRPKPMALVEDRPFMEYVVLELIKHEITNVIFAVGYKGSMVEAYFGDGRRFGITVSYSYEETPLGTAGAIKNAGRFITDERFFILNADTYYRFEYQRLADLSVKKALDMAMVLRPVPDVSRYGEAVLENNRLTGFNEKISEARPGTINGGVYYMKRSLLDEIPKGNVSLERDMIPGWLSGGKALGGIVNDGYFIDIGVPEDYYRFMDDVKKGVVTV